MTKTEYTHKLDELDRLLNDPEVALEPAKVWTLLDEISGQDRKTHPASPDRQARSLAPRGDQKFPVALGTGNRACLHTDHAPSIQS